MNTRIMRWSAAAAVLVLAGGLDAGAQARTPQQILERHTRAIDPQAKLAAAQGVRMVSEFTVPNSTDKMKMTMAFQRPASMFVAVEAPGRGEMKQGFDGTKGWSSEGGATRPLSATEIAQLKSGQGLESMSRKMEQFSKVEAASERPVDGKQADCLKLTWKSGVVSEECYARETGLLVESRSAQETPQGNVETTTKYFDYEPEEGIQVARRMEVTAPGMAQTVRITDVEIGPVDPKLFAPPATASAAKKP